MFKVCNLSFGYENKPIWENVNFEIKTNQLICLLGANGVGKTTFLKTMLGILKPITGEISIDSQKLSEIPIRKTYRKMAYVPQAHNPPFSFEVIDVVLMGRAAYIENFASPTKKDKAVALEALKQINILHLANEDYTKLSGGQKQLVLIARSLAQQSKILIMDEPSSSLDYGNQIRLMHLLKRLSQEGKIIIFSTHDPNHALLYADQVMILDKNNGFLFGKPQQIITSESLNSIYNISVDIHRTDDNNRICIPKI